MSNSIKLSVKAANAITALRDANGTLEYYQNTLRLIGRIFLEQSDEIGLTDTEAIHILRVLHSINCDLEALRGPITPKRLDDRPEIILGRVTETFADINDLNDVNESDPEEENSNPDATDQ